MSNATLASSSAFRNSGRSYTLGQAAQLLGVHINTLRRWCDDGLIQCDFLPSGHRRLKQAYLDAFNGEEADGGTEQEMSGGKGIFIFCRTSSLSQKEALATQRQRMVAAVTEREGIPESEITILTDCCSSFGAMPNCYRLIEAISEGKVRKVYVERFNRLSRQAAFTGYIKHIAEKHGCEIIALDREEEAPDEQQINILELIDFVSCMGNKANGRIGAKLLKKHVDEKTVNRMVELRRMGWGYRQIERQLIKEGCYGEQVGGKKTPLSYEKIRTLLNNGSGKLLGVLSDGAELDDVEKSVRDFISAKVVKSENENDRLAVKDIYPQYQKQCEKSNIQPRGRTWVGRILKSMIGPANGKCPQYAVWLGWKLAN